MINYVSLESALRMIPRPLFEQSNRLDFLSWMLDGYRELKLRQAYQRGVKILEIIDGKLELPKDIKEINLVTYLYKQPTQEDLYSLQTCICNPEETTTTEEDTNNVCQYTLAYRQFLNSPYYHNNFIPLQYKGVSSEIICKDCPNKTQICQYTFTIDPCNVLYTNIKTGYICIDYDTEIVDEQGIVMIPDLQDLKQYLSYYAQYRHWEERASGKEESAFQLANNNLEKANIYYNKVKGAVTLRGLDAHSISMARNGQFNKWIKLPERYVYSR